MGSNGCTTIWTISEEPEQAEMGQEGIEEISTINEEDLQEQDTTSAPDPAQKKRAKPKKPSKIHFSMCVCVYVLLSYEHKFKS